MDKIRKKFFYLKMKSSGYNDSVIQNELEVTDDEYKEICEKYHCDIEQTRLDKKHSKNIGANFVKLTSYLYHGVSDQMNGKAKPDVLKVVEGELIQLPNPKELELGNKDFNKILEQRSSVRAYSDKALSQEELSYLLWTTQGVKSVKETERISYTVRTVPSAGSRHPFETYLMINNVEGMKKGLYFFDAKKHALIALNLSPELLEHIWVACHRQDMVMNCAVNFIWTALPYRTSWRYQERAYRYLYLDAGHVCQNLYLAGEAIDCGVCAIGAYMDEFINEYIGVDGEEEFVIYIASLGKKVEE
jgi:SagB-type dehydrogenase family enzyme